MGASGQRFRGGVASRGLPCWGALATGAPPVAKMSSKKGNTSGKKKGPSKAEEKKIAAKLVRASGSANASMINAAKSLRAMAAPSSSQPEAWPDGEYPVVPEKYHFDYLVNEVKDSVLSNTVAGIVLKPSIKSAWMSVTASANDVLTWASSDHPLLSTYDTNFYLSRCVAASVSIIDWGAFLERGIRVYVGMIPDGSSPPTGVSQFSAMDGVREFTTVKGSRGSPFQEWPWQAITRLSTAHFAGGSVYPSAIGLKDPAVEARDSGVCILFVGDDAATDWNSLQIHFTHHFNFIPFNATQTLFEPELPVGSQAAIDAVASQAEQRVSNSGKDLLSPGVWKNAVEAVVRGDAGSTGSLALDVASGIGRQLEGRGGVVGKVGGFLSKAGSFANTVRKWAGAFGSLFGTHPRLETAIWEVHRDMLALWGPDASPHSPYRDRRLAGWLLHHWRLKTNSSLDEQNVLAWKRNVVRTLTSLVSPADFRGVIAAEVEALCEACEETKPEVDLSRWPAIGMPHPDMRPVPGRRPKVNGANLGPGVSDTGERKCVVEAEPLDAQPRRVRRGARRESLTDSPVDLKPRTLSTPDATMKHVPNPEPKQRPA